jgi:myo-inositol-1(or 4)-monophosphatase
LNRSRGLTQAFRDQVFQTALRAAKASASVLYNYFWSRSSNYRRYKAANDLVTTADLESCRVIKAQVKKDFPTHSLLFEEPEFTEENDSEFLWIIDPLDGTTFHNRGLPYFSLLIALQVRGVTEFGLAYTPITGDLFTAWFGRGGTYTNTRFHIKKSLRVSETRDLHEAVVGYSYGKSISHMRRMANSLKELLPQCRALTRVGGADIGFVAAGNCDAFIDNSSTPWDFAAIALMVREAGGRVTDFHGREWAGDSSSIVACNRTLHPRILEILRSESSSSPGYSDVLR